MENSYIEWSPPIKPADARRLSQHGQRVGVTKAAWVLNEPLHVPIHKLDDIAIIYIHIHIIFV